MRCRLSPRVREMPWSSKWKRPPGSLSAKFRGQKSLADYSPWGCRVGHDWVTNTFTFSVLLYFSSKGYQIHWITIDFPFVRTIKEIHRWKFSNTGLFIWRRYRLCFTHYMIFSTWRSQSMNSVFKHDRIHIYAESGATYMQKHKSVHLTQVFEKCYSVMSYSLWPHGL